MTQYTSVEVTFEEHEKEAFLQLKQSIDDGVSAFSDRDFNLALEKFEAASALAPEHLPVVDVAALNDLITHKQWIEVLLESGDIDWVMPLLGRALELKLNGPLSQDLDFRRTFAEVYYHLNKAFYKAGLWGASLICVNQAIQIAPDPSYEIDLAKVMALVRE